MVSVANINEVLEGHVALEVECVDRLYLNAYVPGLQVGGQVVRFLTGHLGQPGPLAGVVRADRQPVPSGGQAVRRRQRIPVLRLKKPDGPAGMTASSTTCARTWSGRSGSGRFGVVAIVAAQEFQWVFGARNRSDKPGLVGFEFGKAERRVGVYYFYVHDPEFGPGFIKICSYFPYPAKVWFNGHEWAKRQAARAGIAFTALGQRLRQLRRAVRLQAICDRFGPADVQAFFDRWTTVIPSPFTPADRAAGYWWELSMRQVEVSRTLVFDDPRRARRFFEALVADNIDIGRPEQVQHRVRPPVRKTTRSRSAPACSRRHRGQASTSATSTPRQAVPQRRARAADRDGHQQARRPRRPRPARAPARADRESPPDQPTPAYDRACRPELCHRLCAL